MSWVLRDGRLWRDAQAEPDALRVGKRSELHPREVARGIRELRVDVRHLRPRRDVAADDRERRRLRVQQAATPFLGKVDGQPYLAKLGVRGVVDVRLVHLEEVLEPLFG